MNDLDEAETILREVFGLNKYESKVYLALIRGARIPKQISKLSKVPMPRIYDTLASLENKGFIVRVNDEYAPLNPEVIFSIVSKKLKSELEEKIDLMKKSTEQLSKIFSKYSFPSYEGEIIVLRGLPVIVEHFSQLLSKAKNVILLIRKSIEVKEFFKQQVVELRKKGLPHIRALLHSEINLDKDDIELASELGVELRKSNDVMFDMMIIDDDIFVMGIPDPMLENVTEKAIAIIIKNRVFVTALKSYIEERWLSAGKY
ncbi:MAG: TrmB family transcriptional regulator [Thermoprotei archaeon]|jgi:sugar-specific transcriptional regulator TrmB